MSLLLDTNVVLFAGSDPARLGRLAELILTEEVVLSPVVTWEIAIKVSHGRLDLHTAPATYVEQARVATRARWLPISNQHAGGVAELPWHHRDPFDRLLVATAQVEGLGLATTDEKLGEYDVEVLLP